jgi:hypothetical protein
VETTRTSWTTEVESAIRALRDAGVQAVHIQADGEHITELHILSTSRRPAKQIVRDVQTLLRTRFGRSLDHRVVSVVFADASSIANGVTAFAAAAATASAAATAAAPAATPERGPAVATASASEPEHAVADDGRIRFGSVNLYVAGARAQAQVELRWKGVPRMGSASGWSTRAGANRLIAAATVAAIQEYLSEEIALGVDDLSFVRVGKRQAVVASLALIAHRQEKILVGCCTVDQDAQQSVVLATLAALNRVLGGLKTREPVEYVLRPAST